MIHESIQEYIEPPAYLCPRPVLFLTPLLTDALLDRAMNQNLILVDRDVSASSEVTPEFLSTKGYVFNHCAYILRLTQLPW